MNTIVSPNNNRVSRKESDDKVIFHLDCPIVITEAGMFRVFGEEYETEGEARQAVNIRFAVYNNLKYTNL